MIEPVLLALVALVAVPHVTNLDSSSPTLAITIWFTALMARTGVVALAFAWIFFYLPSTELFEFATHWCFHTAVPQMTKHFGLDGHTVGDAATFGPLLLLIISLGSVAYGMVRAARAVRMFVLRARTGAGPQQSIVVRESRVLLAVTGIARPRVVVSHGAIELLDDEELAAGFDHENGHIERHHQRLLVMAELFRAIARFMPGTNAAVRELVFHTERDADQWALGRKHEPSVLASAICKAALSPQVGSPSLAGGQAARRVRALLGEDPLRRSSDLVARGLAMCLAVVVIASAVSLPTVMAAAPGDGDGSTRQYDC